MGKIKVTKSFMDECLFSSWRYFIGRHSIQASMFPDDIARFLGENKGVFTEDRIKFMASDIRREVTDHIHWRDNVSVSGFNDHTDALSLISAEIIQWIADRKIKGISDIWLSRHKFYVDLASERVYISDYESDREYQNTLCLEDWRTYEKWILLANTMDPHRLVDVHYHGHCMEYVCSHRYVLSDPDSGLYKIDIKYNDVQGYMDSGKSSIYLAPEFITDLKVM